MVVVVVVVVGGGLVFQPTFFSIKGYAFDCIKYYLCIFGDSEPH